MSRQSIALLFRSVRPLASRQLISARHVAPASSRTFLTTAFTREQKNVFEAKDSDFDALLKTHGQSKVVIVDFYADWCGPCKLISPILKKVISASDKTVLVLVNVDEAQEVSTKHQIMSLPTIAAFKDGVIVEQFIGARDENFIKTFIDNVTRI